MTKKLTVEDKIAKAIEYCKYSKEKALDNWCVVCFQVEIENARAETETEVVPCFSKYSNYVVTTEKLHSILPNALLMAHQDSKDSGYLSTVRVWIKTYKYGFLVDKEVLNDYEITFKGGVEI